MSNLRIYRGQEYTVNLIVSGNLLDLNGTPIFSKTEAHEIGQNALRFIEYCSSAIDDVHHKGVKNWEIRDLELLSDFADNMSKDNVNLKTCQVRAISVKTRNMKLTCEVELYSKQLHVLNLLRDDTYPTDFSDLEMNRLGI